jgi:cystathionine beta-lyase/cystathionine gamma-synthase
MLVVGSGMSAIIVGLLPILHGRPLIAQRTHYTGTLSLSLFLEVLPRVGVDVTLVADLDQALS